MDETSTVEDDEEFNLFDSAWGKLIGAGVFVAAGFYCDSLFTALETGERESARINWLIALAYESLGHDITVWSLFGVGSLIVLFGVKQLVTGRE